MLSSGYIVFQMTCLRKNQYDQDELEYWVDYRTEGSRGSEERGVLRETMSANTDGMAQRGLTDADIGPRGSSSNLPAGLKEETGLQARCYETGFYSIMDVKPYNILHHCEPDQGVEAIAKIMDSAITHQTKLKKFLDKAKSALPEKSLC